MAITILGGSGSADDSESGPHVVAEINITPLTDVFLVLLIIFMVTTTALSQMGVDVNLPKAASTTAQSQPQGVIITLYPDGSIGVNHERVQSGELGSMIPLLKKAFSRISSRTVILEGDRKAFLGSVIEVMDLAREAGADRFAIATSPKMAN